MKIIISNILLTITYCFIGLLAAIPMSYLFQSDLYNYIGFYEYVSDFQTKVMIGVQFGSWDVYKNTAIAMIILIMVMVNIYKYINKLNQKDKVSN